MKPRFGRAGVAIALTLALHTLLWWLLGARPARPPVSSPRVTVLVMPLPDRIVPPAAPTAKLPPGTNRTATPPRAPAAAFGPLTLPDPQPRAAQGIAASPAEPAASEPAAAAPLNLALPRPRGDGRMAPRSPLGEALDDPRTNTPRAGFGERMARALGTDQARVEEPLDSARVRIRKGSACVVVSRSRESQLDPYNQSVNPSARGVTACN